MATVEESLWWYKFLHKQVNDTFSEKFNNKHDISLLDAGCGTGGLALFLKKKGYKNIKGIDISEDAVEHCLKRQFNVQVGSLLDLDKIFAENSYDAIIFNDVLYFFKSDEIENILNLSYKLLKKKGIIVINLPAFQMFRGIHDLSVGNLGNRYTKNDLNLFVDANLFNTKKEKYWPFLLSPIIFLVRLFQRLMLFAFPKRAKVESDIDLPHKFINKLLYFVCLLEDKLPFNPPWGSSLFVVLEKRD